MNLSHRTENRKGFSRQCPQCGSVIKYTVFNVHSHPRPYFYSVSGESLLLRRSDAAAFTRALESLGENEIELRTLASNLLKTAQPSPDGSNFDLWANIRCKHCKFEFPYNHGVRSVFRRIMDSKIVIIDGTVVLGDSPEESYVVVVE